MDGSAKSMQREMMFFERFMYVDGVTPINCIMTARLRGALSLEALRAALDAVQRKHPLLRARVVIEHGAPHFVIDERTAVVPVRVVERLMETSWQSVTEQEWMTPYDAMHGPLLRLVWLRGKDISELMFVAHHCICDGGSIMMLIREVLQCMDEPATVLEPYESYATIEDLVPAEMLQDKQLQHRVRRKALLFRTFLAIMGRRAKRPIGQPYALYWTADREHFAAINQRCTAEGTNAYAALCVAFLLAFRQVQGKRAKNKLMCPVSIRRYVRAVKADTMFSFAPTVELSLEDELQSFWAAARAMKNSLGQKIESMNVYDELLLGQKMRASTDRLLSFMRASKGGHDLAFSNVGRIRIAPTYKSFTVEAIVGATVAVPWRNANTLISTQFQGEMTLNFLSNDGFLPRDEAVAIQQNALQLLQQAMSS